MTKCSHCNSSQTALVNSFVDGAKWFANPIGMILNGGIAGYDMLAGTGACRQVYCKSCGAYTMECGNCKHEAKLRNKIDHNAKFSCPKCGKDSRASTC